MRIFYIRGMKKLTYLSIVILLAACGGKSAIKDAKKDVLVDETAIKTEQQILMENKIMSMKTFHQEVVGGKPDSTKTELQELKEYDAKGNLVRMESYFGDGGTKHLYTYNSEGKVASFDLKDTKDKLIRHYEFTYENGLNSLKKITGAKGEEISTISHKYDAKGYLIEMINLEKDSTQNSREEYTYDEKGRQVSKKTYDAKKTLKEEIITTYNTDTTYQEVSKYYTVADAPPTETTTKVVMNKNKQVLSKETIDNPKTGVGFRHVYEYDQNGLMLGMWIYDLPGNKATGYKTVSYAKF
jgi:YD repeat-containing protein